MIDVVSLQRRLAMREIEQIHFDFRGRAITWILLDRDLTAAVAHGCILLCFRAPYGLRREAQRDDAQALEPGATAVRWRADLIGAKPTRFRPPLERSAFSFDAYPAWAK
jgi:hypothetical protein